MMKIKQLIAVLISSTTMVVAGQAGAAPVDTDLTGLHSTATIGTATYTQSPFNPAGSGVIDSFVRLNTNNPQEQGYNTIVSNVYDNGSDNIHNHGIQVKDVGFVSTAGGDVMRFLLDINEPNSSNKSKLSLDEVQIFLSRNPDDSAEPALAQGQLLTLSNPLYLVYQMDSAAQDQRVILDGDTGGGSGHGDMILDIPKNLFDLAFVAGGFASTTDKNNAWIYLYSRFGSVDVDVTGTINDANFEEWAAIKGGAIGEPPCTVNCNPQDVPEPGSLPLVALGLLGAAAMSARRRRG
jgi:hypothetical protein